MFDLQPHLSGRVLYLRPVTALDWEGLFAVGSDPEVWEGHPSWDRFLERRFRAYFNEGLNSGAALVAVESSSDQIIGWSRYSTAFVDANEVEIGWTFLGRRWWGGTYNAEMKHLMLQHAFKFVDRVMFRIAETNMRSRKAAQKLGAELLLERLAPIEAGGPKHVFYALERGHYTAG
jgi:RimJ/RimL family protein N-acetyltransferase